MLFSRLIGMGAARKLKHEKLNAPKDRKEAKTATADYFKNTVAKLVERHPVFRFFRAAMRGFHYCKGPRRTGNSWWVDKGRKNAYRAYGIFVLSRKLAVNVAIAKPSRNKKPMVEEPLKLENTRHMEDKLERVKYSAPEKVESQTATVIETPRTKIDRISNTKIKNENRALVDVPHAKLHFNHVNSDASSTEIARGEKAPAVKHQEVKTIGMKISQGRKAETKSIKSEARAEGTKVKPRSHMHTERTPKTRTTAVRIAETKIKTPKTEPSKPTGISVDKIRAPVAFSAPKTEFSDVAIKVPAFALLAASVKAVKAKPEGLIRTIEFPKTVSIKPKEEKPEIDVYSILKGIKPQRFNAPKVTAAADPLS